MASDASADQTDLDKQEQMRQKIGMAMFQQNLAPRRGAPVPMGGKGQTADLLSKGLSAFMMARGMKKPTAAIDPMTSDLGGYQ